MGRFVLVHGAWHDAWCWSRLTPELQRAGHDVVTVSLPSDDPTATFDTYADVVASAIEGDVTLVGHSLAGLTIPLVAARTPVQRLVYLCSLVPIPGRSFLEQLGDEPGTLDVGYAAGLGDADDAGGRRWVDPDLAWRFLYADVDREDADAAIVQLRPQSTSPYTVPCPLDTLAHAPSTYVACLDDRLVLPERSRQVAQGRLDADMVELPGSHSPFWSRPAALAELLTLL